MAVRLRKLEEQTIVITGASSGIGLTTARMAAEKGAAVVLVAREEAALREAVERIRAAGGRAAWHVADVADGGALREVAALAQREFGGFDTWVNNAGVTIFGKLTNIPLEEQRRLFETNYWGTVQGSLIAAEYLRSRGGALINIGSVLSDRAIVDQGPYNATKHAVKGFTNTLRMELERDGCPISVTLIKPGPIDTMFEEHGRGRMDAEPNNPPPTYAPETVARAILYAAEYPIRDLIVGFSGRLMSASEVLAPRLTDFLMERFVSKVQRSGEPTREGDSLFGPAPFGDGQERSGRHRVVRERSYYTDARTHPWTTLALAVGVGAALVAGAKGVPVARQRYAHVRDRRRERVAGYQ